MRKEIVRFNYRLDVSEEQKTEITTMLYSFLKKLHDEDRLKNISYCTIASWWFQYVVKPEWIEEKIHNDIKFTAGIAEFFQTYKGQFEEIIEECSIKTSSPELRNLKNFLKGLSESKGILGIPDYNKTSDVLSAIDRCFYLNNECLTLDENILINAM